MNCGDYLVIVSVVAVMGWFTLFLAISDCLKSQVKVEESERVRNEFNILFHFNQSWGSIFTYVETRFQKI